jgi:hypothetical protein
MSNLIAIAGNAFSGKDSLFICLKEILEKENIYAERYGLADELKQEMYDFIKDKFGISTFTSNIKDKNLIRPIIVEYAGAKRSQTNGTYFTNILQPKIENGIKEGLLPIITDLRFDEFPQDELYWLRKNNGILVYVTRLLQDGQPVPPFNKFEKENNEKLYLAADHRLTWTTTLDMNVRMDMVKLQLSGLIEQIINERKNKRN